MALWRYMVFKIVLLFYRLLNSLTSLAFGFSLFSGHSRERLDMSKVYEKSAHVLKVKWKMRKFELEGPMLKKHFLLRYSQFSNYYLLLLVYRGVKCKGKVYPSQQQLSHFECQTCKIHHLNLEAIFTKVKCQNQRGKVKCHIFEG